MEKMAIKYGFFFLFTFFITKKRGISLKLILEIKLFCFECYIYEIVCTLFTAFVAYCQLLQKIVCYIQYDCLINTFIQQGRIQLIKSDSKDIYNIT